MTKRISRNQDAGNRGETDFQAWASQMGLYPTKITPDHGIDFVCQIRGEFTEELSAEMHGDFLAVSVRSTTQDSDIVKIDRNDAKLYFTASSPFVVAIVKRADELAREKVAIKFLDTIFIEELANFLLGQHKSLTLHFSKAVSAKDEIHKKIDEILESIYKIQIGDQIAEIINNKGMKTTKDTKKSSIKYTKYDTKKRELLRELRLEIKEATNNIEGTYSTDERKIENTTVIMETESGNIKELEKLIKSELELWNYGNAAELAFQLEQSLLDCIGENSISLATAIVLARAYVTFAEFKESDTEKLIARAGNILDRNTEAEGNRSEQNEVRAINASIKSIGGFFDAALDMLNGFTDPFSMRARLALLVRQKKFKEALSYIEKESIHIHWCDLAVVVYMHMDLESRAKRLIDKNILKKRHVKRMQCIIRYANETMAILLLKHGSRAQYHLDDLDREKVLITLNVMESVLKPILEADSIKSNLEQVAIDTAWNAYFTLADSEKLVLCTHLLESYSPISMNVAKSVLLEFTLPSANLPGRLREDYPDEFEANYFALVIEFNYLNKSDKSLYSLNKVSKLAQNDDQKKQVYGLIQQMLQNSDAKFEGDFGKALSLITAGDFIYRNYHDIYTALKTDRPSDAFALLESVEVENNEILLQFRADAYLQSNDSQSAVDDFLRATNIISNQKLLHRTANLAYEIDRIQDAENCLRKVVELAPEDMSAHRNLAAIYFNDLNDLTKSVTEFKILHMTSPNDQMIVWSLAKVYESLFRPDESLEYFNKLCNTETPDKAALLNRAQLLESLGDQEKAFNSLLPFKEHFMEDGDFLFAFMDLAFATGDEEEANICLARLDVLNEIGQLKSGVIEKISGTKEILELMNSRHKQVVERNTVISSSVIAGRMPWIWAEFLVGKPVAIGWDLRTKNLRWIPGSIEKLTSVTTYSTNGFAIGETFNDKRVLKKLSCPTAGTSIVADLSSLLTLFKLNLLDHVADYFSEIIVPEGYLETVLQDSRKMLIGQRSQKLASESIKSLLEKNVIKICRSASDSSVVVVDEYEQGENHCYRLVDLVRPAFVSGKITEKEYDRLSGIQLEESSVDSEHPDLVPLQEIMIELSTLQTLFQLSLLEKVSHVFQLYVSMDTKYEVHETLSSYTHREEVRKQYLDFWSFVRDDSRFKFLPIKVPDEMKTIGDENSKHLSFLASYLAQKEKLPLLVDDRVIQALVLSSPEKVASAAFSSDILVSELLSSSEISEDEAVNAILQLMRWRYRFILPSSNVLTAIVKRFRSNPPGFEMQEVASYVHDCMRDPGLFTGIEDTELGESMASKFYQSWLSVIAEILADVWNDEEFKIANVEDLTRWCIYELVPSTPKVLHGSMRANLGCFTARALLSFTSIQSASRPNPERMIQMMKFLKGILELDDAEYERIIMETVYER